MSDDALKLNKFEIEQRKTFDDQLAADQVNLLFPGDVSQPLILLEVTLNSSTTTLVKGEKEIMSSPTSQAVPLIIYNEQDAFRTTEEFC